MSEQVRHDPAGLPDPAPEPRPHQRSHRVVRSEDLPRFSIGTPIAVGMVIWLVLLTAALIKHDQLQADGHGWWVWCALTGVILGLLGWLYITVRLKDLPGQVVEPHDPPA